MRNQAEDTTGKTPPSSSENPLALRPHREAAGGTPLEADAALRHSHNLMRYIIEHNRSAVAVHDRELKYLYVSQRYLDEYKVKEADVIGKHHYDVFPDLPQKWRDVHQRVLAGEILSAEDDPYVREDGSVDWTRWECRPWYEADGSIGGIIVYTEVITERKRAEDALRKSEQRHRTILQTAMDGFWLADTRGRLIEVNEAYCRMSGYRTEELLTMHISDFEVNENTDDVMAHIEKIVRKGEDRFETRHRRKDGSIFDVETSVQYHPVDGGRFVAFIRDITQRKEIEARLQQAQKMESIGTLAGGIAHDFNNILSPLLGFAELLKEDLPADSLFQYHVNQILKAAFRSRDLVKQILAFSRKQDQNAEAIKLFPIVNEALKLLRSSIPTTIDIQHDIDSGCGIVLADPTQIHQIIMNLATNAYHAMEHTGGNLTIRLAQVELEPGESAAPVLPELAPGPYALLTVSDTGIGMEKAILDKIFDPYFTTKEVGKGTGLGLSVVQGIVKVHKGDILIDSEPGRGTVVNVYLPIMRQPAENKRGETIEPIRGGTEKILLVDDETTIIQIEQRLLEKLGYHTTACTDSLDALERFKADPLAFDLVLTDMTMPHMTGIDLAEKLMSIRPNIPILICTGFSEKINDQKIAAVGIRGVLVKPVVKSELAKMIREVCDAAKSPFTG